MLELLQFRHSPYNEKVRWALDLKGVPHSRRSLLPGPHVPALKRYGVGNATPILVRPEGALAGSAAIMQWLEAQYPNPGLMPSDPAQRLEALRIESWFDDDLTPRIRRPVLEALLQQPGYFARVFADGAPAFKRLAYACLVPIAAPLVRKGNGISGAASLEDGHLAAMLALDFAAQRSSATGYLCGDAFSLADLTVASSLAVLVRPNNCPMSAPQPVAPGFKALMERYAKHPAADWARGIYARHRGAKRDFEGPSTANPAAHG